MACARSLMAVLAVGWALGCNPAESLNPITPSLESAQERVVLPETRVGVQTSAVAVFHNPTGGQVHFQARLEPRSTPLALLDTAGMVATGSPAVLRVVLLPQEAGALAATLVVDHDGAAGPDGTRTLRVPVTANTLGPPDCEDHNPCTLDGVDPNNPALCVHLAQDGSCDDGNACTTADRCVAGSCMGDALHCDDGVDCTMDSCDPVVGCTVQPSAARCDDQDPCTVDVCEPAAPARGCTHNLAPNGTLCGTPTCATVQMCVAGSCTTLPTPEGFPCDDGDACSEGDACRAGVCVPGAGGRTQANSAVVVADPVQCAGVQCDDAESPWDTQRPLAGYWPVALDGVDAVGPDRTLLVWRGAAGPNAPQCHDGPAACHQLHSGCGDDIQGVRTSLLATVADAAGRAQLTTQLDVTTAYTNMAAAIGVSALPTFPPEYSVLAATTAVVNHRVLGAALVAFSSGCSACGVPLPVPPAQDEEPPRDGGSGTAQRPPCVPAGVGLLVFEVGTTGFQLWDARWLGPHFEGTETQRPFVTLQNGVPMLVAHVDQGLLGVAWAHQVGCVGCDAEPSAQASLLLLNPGLSQANIPPRLLTLHFDVNGYGESGGIGDVALTGTPWTLQYTQPSAVVPPPVFQVPCFPVGWRDSWGLVLDGILEVNPYPLSGVVHARLPVMGTGFEWTREQLTTDDGSCVGEDVFSFNGPTAVAVPPVRLAATSGSMVQSGHAQPLAGGPTLLLVTGNGTWITAQPGLAPILTYLEPPNNALGAWMDPNVAPLGSLDDLGGVHLAGLATLGGVTNALPTPALAISATRCVPRDVTPPDP